MKYIIDKKLRKIMDETIENYVEVIDLFDESYDLPLLFRESKIKRSKVDVYEKKIIATLDIFDYTNEKKWKWIACLEQNALKLYGNKQEIMHKIEQINALDVEFERASQVFFSLLEMVTKKNEDWIEEISDKLDELEDELMRKKMNKDFENQLLQIKKKVWKAYRYHQQLKEMLETIVDCPYLIIDKQDVHLFRYLYNRIDLCTVENEKQKEQILSLYDMYQLTRNERQDNAIRYLTIITSIFIPLTFITGWYGMNFKNMPELSSPYGYFGMILASILILLIELYIFKKKKWL